MSAQPTENRVDEVVKDGIVAANQAEEKFKGTAASAQESAQLGAGDLSRQANTIERNVHATAQEAAQTAQAQTSSVAANTENLVNDLSVKKDHAVAQGEHDVNVAKDQAQATTANLTSQAQATTATLTDQAKNAAAVVTGQAQAIYDGVRTEGLVPTLQKTANAAYETVSGTIASATHSVSAQTSSVAASDPVATTRGYGIAAQEQVVPPASNAASTASNAASNAAATIQTHASNAKDAIAPHAQYAADTAAPYVAQAQTVLSNAATQASEAAAPYVDQAKKAISGEQKDTTTTTGTTTTTTGTAGSGTAPGSIV